MKDARAVLVVPTYNERDNIGALIEALQKVLPAVGQDVHILVVDDNSPDGTAAVVAEKQRRYPNVHLISGRKAGLGAAYIRGMRYALEELEAGVVFEMDADFSHEPGDVPRLMGALQAGADLAIGSRYIAGGELPPEWGLPRRLNSLFGNLVARYLGGMRQVRDCTAGFRAIRAALLRAIDPETLESRGYAFQIDLLSRALQAGARVVEIPVRFVDREKGESKLGLSDILEFCVVAARIRVRRMRRFLKFCIVGATGVVVNLGIFTVLLRLGLDKYIASPIAIEASIISNFLLNNGWTFGDRRTGRRLHAKGLRFNLVSVLALGLSYSTFVVLSALFADVQPQIHQLAGILPAVVVNYLMNSRWTFAPVRPTPAAVDAVPRRRLIDRAGNEGDESRGRIAGERRSQPFHV
ncbi:MAG: glycosyltransferase family 2 protein [Chromatiales bacterium]|jgi:dolichol-phosphate mannosyltransferase